MNISLVDVFPDYDPETMSTPDGLHPNNLGNIFIADKFETALITPVPVYPDEPDQPTDSNLHQIIELYSKYRVGDTTTDNISLAQLALLESSTLDEATRLNQGRFTGIELTRLHAYVILDKWVNKPGKGIITAENTKDSGFKAEKSIHSSYFMDELYAMIDKFDSANLTAVTVDTGTSNESVDGGGVIRSDSYMPELSDYNYVPEYEGD
jgi:hypothetical protein